MLRASEVLEALAPGAPGPAMSAGLRQQVKEVRIGILGAARIAERALLEPARAVPSVTVVAVATRDKARAEAFALQHGLPVAHASYELLLADPGIDAVYIPLPNALHAPWTLRAIDAGKHVLCEKPFASNAREAASVAAAAAKSGAGGDGGDALPLSPACRRLTALISDGAIGTPRHIQAWTSWPVADPRRHPLRLRARRRRADGRRLLRDRLPAPDGRGGGRGRAVGHRRASRPASRHARGPGPGARGSPSRAG